MDESDKISSEEDRNAFTESQNGGKKFISDSKLFMHSKKTLFS